MIGDDVRSGGDAKKPAAASSANAAMQAGAWDEALLHWARRRAEAPSDSDAYVRAAQSLRRLARAAEAQALLLEAEQRGIDDVRIHAGLAEMAVKKRDWEEAERRWRAVLAREERHQAATIELARLLIGFGQGLEADPCLTRPFFVSRSGRTRGRSLPKPRRTDVTGFWPNSVGGICWRCFPSPLRRS